MTRGHLKNPALAICWVVERRMRSLSFEQAQVRSQHLVQVGLGYVDVMRLCGLVGGVGDTCSFGRLDVWAMLLWTDVCSGQALDMSELLDLAAPRPADSVG